MRKFVTSCKDSKTGYEMILSECSYNMAMDWLEKEMNKYGLSISHIETTKEYTKIYTEDDKSVPGRTFVYDEERGYLLGN